MQDRLTNSERSLVHRPRCTAQSFADTRAEDLPSQKVLLRFQKTDITERDNSATEGWHDVYLMSAIVNRKMSVQIIPRMSLRLPSMISVDTALVTGGNATKQDGAPSGPIFVSLTPLDVINSSALFTFSAFWTLIRGALLYRPRETSPGREYVRLGL